MYKLLNKFAIMLNMKSSSNKTSKIIISSGADVTLNAKTKQEVEMVRQNVLAIAKQTDCNPQKLLEYVKMSGTPVYKMDYADKFLALLKEEEGLIYEQRGFKALYLSLITGQGLKFKTAPMFILRDGVIEKYYMLHHFYRWYEFKSNLPGLDYNSQKKFRKYLENNSQSATQKLDIKDIIDIKEAIARDQEATEFVLEYTKSVDGSKNVMNKIKNDGGASI